MPVPPVRHAPPTPERCVWWWHRREAAYREGKDMEEAAQKARARQTDIETRIGQLEQAPGAHAADLGGPAPPQPRGESSSSSAALEAARPTDAPAGRPASSPSSGAQAEGAGVDWSVLFADEYAVEPEGGGGHAGEATGNKKPDTDAN